MKKLVFFHSVLQSVVSANFAPSSLIPFTLMMQAIRSYRNVSSYKRHTFTSQETVFFIVSAIKATNITCIQVPSNYIQHLTTFSYVFQRNMPSSSEQGTCMLKKMLIWCSILLSFVSAWLTLVALYVNWKRKISPRISPLAYPTGWHVNNASLRCLTFRVKTSSAVLNFCWVWWNYFIFANVSLPPCHTVTVFAVFKFVFHLVFLLLIGGEVSFT
jgi:hypothetical protein